MPKHSASEPYLLSQRLHLTPPLCTVLTYVMYETQTDMSRIPTHKDLESCGMWMASLLQRREWH